MNVQNHLSTRRAFRALAAASLFVALGSTVAGCARNATRSTLSPTEATQQSEPSEPSDQTVAMEFPGAESPSNNEPTPVSASGEVPQTIDAEAPTTPPTESGGVTQTTLPRPDEFQILVTMLQTGGRCAGPCADVKSTLFSDGTWTYGVSLNPDLAVTATTLPPAHGEIDAALTNQIKTALAKTTAAELQALPVTQQYCPSAADGRDLSFTYRLRGAEVTVSDCTVDLLEANELLRLTSLAREHIAIMANQKG
jgi:hypothetical protein